MTQVNSVDHELIEPTKIVSITMRDGVTLYAALFLPRRARALSDALRSIALPLRQ